MTPRTLRIFISSPGDVDEERRQATRVLERLRRDFARYVELQPILWEHEPQRATAHFQEQIVLPSQTDIVVCILWSRLGTRLPPDKYQREDGTPYLSGTEFEFEDAAESYRENGTPDLLVYRKTSEPLISLTDEQVIRERLEQKRALEAFWDRWFGNPRDAFQAAFTTFESPRQFADLLEDHLRKLISDRLPPHAADDQPLARWTKDVSPYRGLEAFDAEHATVYYGRKRAVDDTLAALSRQHEKGCAFLLIFGMSGCGKSSLVRAGILPTLMQLGADGIDLWRHCIFRPSDAGVQLLDGPVPEASRLSRPGSSTDTSSDLLDGLALALIRQALPELEELQYDARTLAGLCRDAPQYAVPALRAALQRAGDDDRQTSGLPQSPVSRLVVVVDQMEELFTLERVDTRGREDFIAVLSALARSGFVWVIATMRSEFYPRCAEIPDLVALKEGDGQYDLLPPTVAEIGEIIRFPARAADLHFEVADGKRLDDVLHEEAARNPTALPLLEFTLDELYQKRDNGVLTFAEYERLGGLEGALAKRAEEVFATLEPSAQDALPSILRALVTVGHGGEDLVTARRVPLLGPSLTPERQALLQTFIDARLLVSDRTSDGQPVVEVAHESLLQHWPRVQQWLAEDREFLRARARVADAAALWRQEHQRADFLLAEGKPLADAQDLLARRRQDLETELVGYVEASMKYRQRIRRRKKLVVASVVTAFFTVISVFSVVLYYQWQEAVEQAARAEENFRQARKAVDDFYTHVSESKLLDVPGLQPLRKELLEDALR